MSYVPLTDQQANQLLSELNIHSIDELFSEIESKNKPTLDMPNGQSDIDVYRHMLKLANQNRNIKSLLSFLGGGAYEHFIPSTVGHVLRRSEFYTAYTPYQPELSQGSLKSIFEFQTSISELYGLEIANASIYDGASALAEACVMAMQETGRKLIIVPQNIPVHYQQVLKSYLIPKGAQIVSVPLEADLTLNLKQLESLLSDTVAAVLLAYPDRFGMVNNYSSVCNQAESLGVFKIFTSDPIAMGLLAPPGQFGADIAVGEGQALGLPLSYGGPYIGLLAAKQRLIRSIPGRIVGKTVDQAGNVGYCLTFQTREQHIRREKSLSNICSNQALMALANTVYLATMGPNGLKQVAQLCVEKTQFLKRSLVQISGLEVINSVPTFKEFVIRLPIPAIEFCAKMEEDGILAGIPLIQMEHTDPYLLLVAVTEMKSNDDLIQYVSAARKAILS